MAEHDHLQSDTAAGHELSDLNPRNIALFGAGLALLLGASLLAGYALFHFFNAGITKSRPLPSPLSYSREPTPEPRLAVKPGSELSSLRTQEDKMLSSYGWIDRDRGIVRIPIERALDILAEKRLPTRQTITERADARTPAVQRKVQGQR